MTNRQTYGTMAAIKQDRERIEQLRADDELRNGRTLPPPLPQPENDWTSFPGGYVKDDVEWNLEKSSRESELLAWCDDLKAERDELRDATLEIANHNTQLLEVCAKKDETIAHLRACIERSHQAHLEDIRELQKTIDDQDSQIENLFQQLQESDNRPY